MSESSHKLSKVRNFNITKKKKIVATFCMLLPIHLTLKYLNNTLLSLVNGSPVTTAFIIEILSCQVTLHTCQERLKGTALAPLLCCSAWFFIALHSRPIQCRFQPYVNIIHFRMWQLLTVRHCDTTSSQNRVYITEAMCYPLLSAFLSHTSFQNHIAVRNVLKMLHVQE